MSSPKWSAISVAFSPAHNRVEEVTVRRKNVQYSQPQEEGSLTVSLRYNVAGVW